jgi:hypothetical protein
MSLQPHRTWSQAWPETPGLPKRLARLLHARSGVVVRAGAFGHSRSVAGSGAQVGSPLLLVVLVVARVRSAGRPVASGLRASCERTRLEDVGDRRPMSVPAPRQRSHRDRGRFTRDQRRRTIPRPSRPTSVPRAEGPCQPVNVTRAPACHARPAPRPGRHYLVDRRHRGRRVPDRVRTDPPRRPRRAAAAVPCSSNRPTRIASCPANSTTTTPDGASPPGSDPAGPRCVGRALGA